MKITAIKNFKSFVNKYVSFKRINSTAIEPIRAENLKNTFERNPITDTFQKQNHTKSETKKLSDKLLQIFSKLNKAKTINSFLNIKNINPQIYDRFSNKELSTIRSILKPDLIFHAKTMVSTSKIIKSIFDKKYGEGKYTFVSIGRSLSATAKCLEFMGIKTKQIPYSNHGSKSIKNTVDNMTKQKGFKKYKKFLEKNIPHTPNNKYLLCDYAYSGETLKTFKAFLEHPKVKLHSKKSEYIEINHFLEKNVKKYNDVNTIYAFNGLLYNQRFDTYAEISSLNFKELGKLNSSLTPTSSIHNKLMKFCMLDILKNPKVYE